MNLRILTQNTQIFHISVNSSHNYLQFSIEINHFQSDSSRSRDKFKDF